MIRQLFPCGLALLMAASGWSQTAELIPLVSGVAPATFSETVGPGEDFYEYVNQQWLAETEIPADRSNYGAFSILEDQTQAAIRELIESAAAIDAPYGSDEQKVGDFYRSVLDVATRDQRGVAPVADLLKLVNETASVEQLSVTLAELQRRGVGVMFGHYIEPDARRSKEYGVYITQSGLTMPDRDYYLVDEPRYVELRTELLDYVGDLLEAAGHPEPLAAARNVLDLETKIAEAHWTNVENRDPVKTYNKLTKLELASDLKELRWLDFVDAAGMEAQAAFIVRQPSFLKAVDNLLGTMPLAAWKDYLTFRVMDSYASALTQAIELRHFQFHEAALSGVAEQKPMWRRGVEASNAVLGEIVGRLYVQKYFPPVAKERMVELVDNLKNAFGERIDQLDWMSPSTKQQAREKLAKFNTKIGYPDEWKDYSKLAIVADDLVGNLMRAAQVEYQREVEKLGGPIDRNEWHMTPQTVNAYYNPLMNEIVFPAAILQPPFFNLLADDAVNYGAIGAVIGHEISHGFDDKGSQYDGDGNLRDWWSEHDRKEFERRAEQLVKQYAEYRPFPDMQINGELTLGENIGDLGGLSGAYAAYRRSLDGQPAPVIDGLTGDQRFFLGWSQVWRRKYREPELRRRLITDPHSPSRYRVIGIVSNMDAYYEAFGVKAGDAMYIAPEDRVRIW